MTGRTIVWFRQDLRLADHPALAAAIAGGSVQPVYIWAPEEEGRWAPGGATRWWLHHALADLQAGLRETGSDLCIVDARGRTSLDTLNALVAEFEADAVFWSRRYEPSAVGRDSAIKSALKESGVEAKSFNGSLLFEPTEIRNKAGTPFKVFTPFWNHLQTREVEPPAKVDLKAIGPALPSERGVPLEALTLLPTIPWDVGFAPFWGGEPSRALVEKKAAGFVRSGANDYPETRNTPSEDGTSRLSAYLHFGQIGPRELWWKFAKAKHRTAAFDTGVMRQLVWRDFAHHILFHFPHTTDAPLRPEFERFPWTADEPRLQAWQRGLTGYPIVDAGMRQLWKTGWMHNRVRMIVASFLVKHLLVHPQEGARWFWETLADADLANNAFGWQWTAGCGADAAPYFRIFNPISQGQKFDPEGDYVREFVPELGQLPKKFIHCPWEMGELELRGCGVTLGRDYPEPIVDHAMARKRALEAFASLKD